MLGNAEEAQFIRDWYIELRADPDRRYDHTSPEGWRRLGAGCYRTVFLAPSGVVYKVEQYYNDNPWSQSNKSEDAKLRKYRFRKMPQGCRLPRWSFYELDGRGVMAMERFDKLLRSYGRYTEEGAKYYQALSRLTDRLVETGDWHSANLAVDTENELLVPIDLGG